MLDQSHSISHADRPDPVPLILDQLASGNDVIRTGAVRAMAAVAITDDRVRSALLERLLDEDPDVRTDAMDALVQCARPEDAETLRRSLQGDPVREVKLASIRALTLLNDTESVALFRNLVASRARDDVAWEDDTDAWDDWLDIQVAVIRALGQLDARESIEDILAARDDEAGQNLDDPVFNALAAMGSEGAVWLLSVAKTEPGLARKRALEALGAMQSELLADYVDTMLADEAADVRRLAIPLLGSGDERAEALALNDPDADLRCQALAHYCPECPDLALKALSDRTERVQAIALGHLELPLDDDLQTALVDNAIIWLRLSGDRLAGAAARLLPRIAPEQAAEELMQLVRDTSRPLEARLAGVDALAEMDDATACERLISLSGNPTQQVRTVALSHLVKLGRAGDVAAIEAMAMSIEGTFLAPDRAVVEHEPEDGPDATAPKEDQIPQGHLRISSEGEIIEADRNEAHVPGQSTLSSIQYESLPVDAEEPTEEHIEERTEESADGKSEELAEDTPEESPHKRRRRRAVEGPDTVADDLRIVALGIAGDMPDPAIEIAVAEAAQSSDAQLRLAAFRALLKRAVAGFLSPEYAPLAQTGLVDEIPAIRSTAAEILALTPDNSDALADCIEDDDALVRLIAVRNCATDEQALGLLADPVLVVRQAALERLLPEGRDDLAGAAFDALFAAQRVDTLAEANRRSDRVLTRSIQALSDPDLTPKQAHVILEAMARSTPQAR